MWTPQNLSVCCTKFRRYAWVIVQVGCVLMVQSVAHQEIGDECKGMIFPTTNLLGFNPNRATLQPGPCKWTLQAWNLASWCCNLEPWGMALGPPNKKSQWRIFISGVWKDTWNHQINDYTTISTCLVFLTGDCWHFEKFKRIVCLTWLRIAVHKTKSTHNISTPDFGVETLAGVEFIIQWVVDCS